MSSDTHTTTFHQIGNHDDYRHALLPDHSPETVERRRKWALGTDVSSRPLPSIDVICINVILTLFRWPAATGQQLHTGMIVCIKMYVSSLKDKMERSSLPFLAGVYFRTSSSILPKARVLIASRDLSVVKSVDIDRYQSRVKIKSMIQRYLSYRHIVSF